ncbi:uncharacterized protein LY89DRAFT_758083 [Mollisia scopiformis]|uniref:P-loop containing nucleoside triphosphate hydrolase protein n=1 Tax=Mollisia scopiformis TaxID=149040 RepID=A0A194WU19_MOLSC|nr:uncharacterized protein LY89DRAFT_758083 [Mollisia scopiformis]KUJ11455.1 hypothetical protein LY89DRAFT_758083 [Mollisia scopiformis]
MFPGNLNIDRRKCKRTVPMQVLSLGMSRTGTASLKVAFHILGYHDVFHNLNTSQNLREWDIWNELAQAKYAKDPDPSTIDWRKEFDGLLGHCEAVTDTPPAYFAPELITAYPEAKVVIPLLEAMWNPIYKVLAFLDPQCVGKWHASNKEEMRMNLRAAYYEHYDTIRAVTPPERLLEYELGSGWEPLCKFLGKPVPNEPFPRVNEKAALKEWIAITTRRSMFNALRSIVIVGGSFGAVVFGLYYKLKN